MCTNYERAPVALAPLPYDPLWEERRYDPVPGIEASGPVSR